MALELRHPSKAKLLNWLETGEPGKVQDHVENCERCADRLVVLDQDSGDVAENRDRSERRLRITQLLTDSYQAPEDLNERVVQGVEQRSKTEAELVLFAGLMAVGFDTARLITYVSGQAAVELQRPDGARHDVVDNEERYGHQGRMGDDSINE